MYLLDTNVVSETYRAIRKKADLAVMSWLGSVPSSRCFLSVLTLMELDIGVLRLERRDPRQGEMLRYWFEERVQHEFADRVLVIDAPVARRCARLHVPDPASERDALLAATAMVHGMTLVTRNESDFRRTGAVLLNPWKA